MLDLAATRDEAIALQGLELLAAGDALDRQPHYRVGDLLGLPVRTASGRAVGEVRDVLEAPAHEILAVRAPDGGDVLIPLVDELITPAGRRPDRRRRPPRRAGALSVRFDVFTLFPEAFAWYLGQVHIRAATGLGHEFVLTDYRDHTPLGHQQVDDTPYGGGAGMVLRIDVVCAALEAVFGGAAEHVKASRRVVELTPKGRQLDDALATELAGGDLVLLCGRYEGIDERVAHLVSDRVSIGPYVLSGGEIAAMATLDAVTRKLPGVISNPDSVVSESHAPELEGGAEYPHYTRPAEFRGWEVPEVLRSGHHAEIARWRAEQVRKR